MRKPNGSLWRLRLLMISLPLFFLLLAALSCTDNGSGGAGTNNGNLSVEYPSGVGSGTGSHSVSVSQAAIDPCRYTDTSFSNTVSSSSTTKLSSKGSLAVLSKPCGNYVREVCGDSQDNNGNGLIDEGCYGCCTGAKPGDFDCDGKVTKYDCSFPILYGNSVTTINYSATCADLDKDGYIGVSDAVKCLELMHQEGG